MDGTSGPSEETYKTIFQHAGIAIAVLDSDLTISSVNLDFLRLFGRTPQSVEGKKWTEIASVKSMEAIRRYSAQGPRAPALEYEITYTGLDGLERQILVRISNLPVTGGFVACFLDVTSEIHAGEALWEAEEKFQALFDGAAVGMSLVDLLEGRIIISNPAMQKMLGYTAEELSRKKFASFTHPDDVEDQWTLYKEMAAGNLKHFEIKKRYIRKDGAVVWARLVANVALRSSGRPAVVIGMIDEIN